MICCRWKRNSESTYVDTGCWPELKHSAGLGFRNAGQDPISTDIQKPHTTYIYILSDCTLRSISFKFVASLNVGSIQKII
ncbi:hypothetical protein GLOIN_2v1482187 [Rhizophagus irregularis DAOM 181602=DAOM 197198]|nr:hypothetical protein GLOIN_2v1482187 [Rhizophagus irregularis DAOM 181602=DAOM 197198]